MDASRAESVNTSFRNAAMSSGVSVFSRIIRAAPWAAKTRALWAWWSSAAKG